MKGPELNREKTKVFFGSCISCSSVVQHLGWGTFSSLISTLILDMKIELKVFGAP